jgi:hypothetical protein
MGDEKKKLGGPDEKRTVEIAIPPTMTRPNERPTEEMATGPVILGELRNLRREGNERGAVVQTIIEAVKTLDGAVKTFGIQIQQIYEQHGGKIRTLESRADTSEGRHSAVEARTTVLESRLNELQKESEAVRKELATLRDTKLGVSTLPGMEAKISLSEEQMAEKLEEESKAHAAKLAEETEAREELDKRIDARLMPQELKLDTLLRALNVRPPPPPGSNPPAASGSTEKNAIQKQTFWTKIAAGVAGLVGAAGALDKMGVFTKILEIYRDLRGH